MGKTALMQRLFNITFHKNPGVIPFYYEIKEGEEWVMSFAEVGISWITIDGCLNETAGEK